jgi:hypothetical protein
MKDHEPPPQPAVDRKPESDEHSADPAVGTESAAKGGADAAKRQAERDWQDSAKEEGE